MTLMAYLGSLSQTSGSRSVRVRALRDGIVLGGVLVCALLVVQEIGRGWIGDPYAYWSTPLDKMQGFVPGAENYAYSPAWAQVFSPLTMIPWPAFRVLWSALALGAAIWLSGPVPAFWRPAFLVLCLPEVIAGNIILLLAVAAVIGMRSPAAWAFVLLSKVTPGVALGWYVGRREWRPLATAVGVTAAIVVVSYLWTPAAWHAWMATLIDGRDATGVSALNAIAPWWLRISIGGLVAMWGGRTGRPWTIAVAMLLATPHLWLQSLVVLAAIPRLQAMPGLSDTSRSRTQAAMAKSVA
jgi:hypothetical protein